MAWPTPALDGLLLTDNSNGRRWLHALCQAVNERQLALGLSLTEFVKADGTEDADITFADLEGGWIGGPDDCAITNLNRCMAAIKSMLTQVTTVGTFDTFLESAAYGATAWTLSSLQTDIGLGAFADEATDWAELKFWKQMKEALDRMTFCRKVSVASGGSVKKKAGGPYLNDIEQSWDDAVADTPASDTWAFTKQAGIFNYGNRSGFDVSAGVDMLVESKCFFVNACLGSLEEAYYNVIAVATAYVAPAWELGPVGGTMVSFADSFSGNVAGADLALASSNQSEYGFTFTLPGTVPPGSVTSPPSGAGSFTGYWCYLNAQYADFYIDITAELTDQS
jgi:hypothetical protein